jgi:isocitrate dehydrogenase kinase/phosphatase
MSSDVWYPVGPRDVFPETFGPFLLGNTAVREVFMRHHADLLDEAFWNAHKARIQAGHVHDVFPYDLTKRFAVQRRLRAQEASAVNPGAGDGARLPVSMP